MKVTKQSYKNWKEQFDKEYNLLKDKLIKKVDNITIGEFEKFKKRQIKLAVKMGVFQK